MVVWVLVTMSILWGLVLSSRLLRGRATPGWVLDLHRYLGGLSVAFVGIHIAGLVADNYVHFGWSEILVPMGVGWRPGAVAWGIAGFYALIAIEVTSLLRPYIPRKVWRSTHYLSIPLFGACTVHGLQSGRDAGNILLLPSLAFLSSPFWCWFESR
jgi:predicted ferric reductase